MDAVTAAEVADMAAKGSAMTGASSSGVDGGGDARTVQSLENAFAKKWKAAAVQRGVVFSHVDEPLVGEPNRQLKVPVPQHRVVNQKLDGSPVQDGGIVTGDYVAGGAASLLAGNVTKTKAALR
jgi:hypothetical protein